MIFRKQTTLTGFAAGLALLFCTAVPVLSQNANQRILEIRQAYEQLNFQEAEIKATAALGDYGEFSTEQLAEVHKYLALVFYSQNRPDHAEEQFNLALDLKPALALDSLYTSPKILAFFQQIKNGKQTPQAEDAAEKTSVRYVFVEDRRPAAALRSLALPGWGQMYKGEKNKGVAMMTLWGIGLAGTAVTHFARQNAEDKYLAETDPELIESRYRDFNKLHKLRNNLALVTAGVWLVSYFDAFLHGGRPSQQSQLKQQSSFKVQPSVSWQQVGLSVQF